MDQGEPGLVANRVKTPEFRNVDVIFGGETAGDIDAIGRHIQMERSPCSSKMSPLRHGLEVIHRLGGLYLYRSEKLLSTIRSGQH